MIVKEFRGGAQRGGMLNIQKHCFPILRTLLDNYPSDLGAKHNMHEDVVSQGQFIAHTLELLSIGRDMQPLKPAAVLVRLITNFGSNYSNVNTIDARSSKKNNDARIVTDGILEWFTMNSEHSTQSNLETCKNLLTTQAYLLDHCGLQCFSREQRREFEPFFASKIVMFAFNHVKLYRQW